MRAYFIGTIVCDDAVSREFEPNTLYTIDHCGEVFRDVYCYYRKKLSSGLIELRFRMATPRTATKQCAGSVRVVRGVK